MQAIDSKAVISPEFLIRDTLPAYLLNTMVADADPIALDILLPKASWTLSICISSKWLPPA
jgi:hypothetical protein